MAKGISPLISTVIVIMMVVSAISMVLLIGRPTIDKATEASVVNEALLNMKSIDSAIKEVASEGVQSSRTVTFKVSDGSYRIVNDSGVLFEKELLQPVYSFNTITFDGNIKSAAGINPLGLVGFWKFDEGGGTAANDSSGHGHDGTFVGFPIWTIGKFGGALNFSGGVYGTDYVSVPDSNDWYLSGDYTIDLWVKFDSLPQCTGCYMTIWSQYINSDNWQGLWIENNAGIYDFEDAAYSGGTFLWNYWWASSPSLNTETWYHIAIVRSGNTHYGFQNGISLVGDSGDPYAPPTEDTGSRADYPTSLLIGSDIPGIDQNLNGSLDELHIYHRALSTSEIRDAITADPKHYYIAIDYDRIQIVGTDIFQKGNQKLCIEKIGETGNKAVVEVRLC